MAISVNLPYKKYTGNGSATEFDFGRKILSSSDIQIQHKNTSTGTITNWAYGVEYTATGFGTDSVTVTTTDTLTSNERITIYTVMDKLQENDYVDLDQFPADRFEDDLDKLCMEIQELYRLIEQCVRVGPDGIGIDEISGDIVNTTIVFGSDGNPTTISNDTSGATVINLQEETAYTLQLSDIGGVVEMDHDDPNTLTIPPYVDEAIPIKSKVDVTQIGEGLTTIAAGSGVSLRGDLVSRGQYHGFSLYKRGTDDWVVIGGTTA